MNKRFITTVCVLSSFISSAFSQKYLAQVKSIETGDWGYVDHTGTLVIPATYGKCHEFSSNGLAPIYTTKGGEHYYFINTKNEVLATDVDFRLVPTAMGYDILNFNDGYVPVRVGKKYGYLNSQGKLAIPAKYEEVVEFDGGYGVGRINKEYWVINEQGEEFPVLNAMEVRHFSEGLAPYRSGNKKFGFIGTDGKVVIPAAYETVGYFSGGLAWVRFDDGKIGFINTKGEVVIKPQFDFAMNINPESGIARIKLNGRWGYVNKSGEIKFIKDTDIWGDFGNGLALGRKGKKFGFFDFEGNWVIQPAFDHAREFKNGFAAVLVGKKWGFIDTSGKWVIEPTFDAAKDMELINE